MLDESLKRVPLAHVAGDGRTHALIDHLKEVGRLAGQFASAFGSTSWAKVAGHWHDPENCSPEDTLCQQEVAK